MRKLALYSAPASPSRRRFLEVGAAAGGGLLVSVALPAFAQKDRNEKPPEAVVGAAAERVSETAEGFSPNAFIRIDREGLVTLVMHKVEMGQATFTSIPMLIAEELEVDLDAVRLEQAPPNNELYGDPLLGGQVTGGSTSVRGAWKPMREAGAAARMLLVQAAATQWGVDPASCTVQKGKVVHKESGRELSYGEVADAAAKLPVPTDLKLKPASEFTLIGKPLKRLDGREKIDGTARFGIDVQLPGMGIAAVSASPVPGGTLASVQEDKAMAVKGVRQVVKLENAVAVVGDHMWAARQGLAALDAQWSDGPHGSVTTESIVEDMRRASEKTGAVARNEGDAGKAIGESSRRVEAIYEMPFLAHATMEPMNCTVDLRAEACDIWTGTQVPTIAQGAAAKITGLPLDKIQVHNHYLGGGFGRRLEVDMVVQALQFAKQIKGPVKFVWSREEDIQHDMYRPYYFDRMAAALDDKGMPVAWSHRITASSIMARFAPAAVKDGIDSDAVEAAQDHPYVPAIPNVRVEYVRHEPPFPTAFWRGVGPTHNVWVVESFIDELAKQAGQDPVAYRKALLTESPRVRNVLELAASKAGWDTPLAQQEGRRVGRGVSAQFAFGSYMAMVAEVSVGDDGQVAVHRVVCAVDCGQVINPDHVKAQLEGGVIFGLTAALWNEITFDRGRVQQSNFGDYRMMRINETPVIEVHLVDSQESPGGIGEPGTSAIAPALTNAVFAATGVRIRKLPIAAEELRATT